MFSIVSINIPLERSMELNSNIAPTLVLGEAPESDDEISDNHEKKTQFAPDTSVTKPTQSAVLGTAITGEAIESDEEIELHNTETSIHQMRSPPSAGRRRISGREFRTTITPPITKNIESYFVRRLCDKNRSLHDGMTSFKKSLLNSTNNELSNINQQLLRSQIELQQTLTNIRTVTTNLTEIHAKLNDIMLARYIPAINIKVPAHII